MNEKEKFEFSYSSALKNDLLVAEVLHEEYSETAKAGKKIDGINEIKKLDRKAKLFPLLFSLLVGTVGAAIFGTGLFMIFARPYSIVSFIVAIAGTVPVILCIPVYNIRFKRARKKYGPRIIELTEEIIKKNQK